MSLLNQADDNVKYFKKWLKLLNLNVERYGNELLLDDDTYFICQTTPHTFEVKIVLPDKTDYTCKTKYIRDVDDINRFDTTFFIVMKDVLNRNGITKTT